ncbi:MAG: carbohydrate porin [Alphaproteobacteria bacterium]|nr:carbohydrate porin [Alphaproteobacteria bacterium]
MPKIKASVLSACVLAAVSGVAHAENANVPMGAVQGAQLHSQTMAADTSAPSPYTLKLQYTGEAWDNMGGLHTGTAYLQNVDAQFAADTGKAFGWTGGRFFIEGFYNSSRSLDTQYDGALQDPSVIDTSGQTMFRLYQAYYDQNLGNTDLLLGLYDMQTEFANTKPMDIFFNGAYAWNTALDQSGGGGLNGPSTFPSTALAFRARQKISNEWSVQGAVLDGMSDSAEYPGINDILMNKKYGILGIGEVDYTPAAAPRTKVMAGYWGYTGKFDTLNETNADGSTHQVYGSDGGYVGAATRLYEQTAHRGLDGFVNIGFADPTVNIVDRTINAGLSYTGPFEARPWDRVGVAFSVAGISDPYRKAQSAAGTPTSGAYETNIEATYRATVNDWLTVQPDIQYTMNPAVDPNLKNDFLVGVHFEIGHLFHM